MRLSHASLNFATLMLTSPHFTWNHTSNSGHTQAHQYYLCGLVGTCGWNVHLFKEFTSVGSRRPVVRVPLNLLKSYPSVCTI